ncbi:hypothetical protein C0J29_21850 [Mycobacterium paragordonae]|nr:hypothetical protein C0J29_21850 [Mycobacterium paragordonae]
MVPDRDIVCGVLQTVVAFDESVDMFKGRGFGFLARTLGAVEVIQVVEERLADIRLYEVGQLIVFRTRVAEILIVVNCPL